MNKLILSSKWTHTSIRSWHWYILGFTARVLTQHLETCLFYGDIIKKQIGKSISILYFIIEEY